MHSNEAFPVIDKLRSAITPEVYFKHEEDRDMLVVARVVGEHVLIMGDTGTGKSTLSRAMAALSGEEFGRIQGDPSNTTKDIIGWYFYDQVKNKREFVKGPIHQPVVMIEEYNRNNPHTQSAFIQAMDEKQVTLSDGKNIALPKDQWIIATLNKQAQSDGVYIIDRPQLDRFGMSLDLSEPYDEQDLQSIWQIKSAHYQQEKKTPEKVISVEELVIAKRAIENIMMNSDPNRIRFAQKLVRLARGHKDVDSSRSVLGGARAAQVMLKMAAGKCAMENRVTLEESDIKEVCVYSLRHRLELKIAAQRNDQSAEKVIQETIRLAE